VWNSSLLNISSGRKFGFIIVSGVYWFQDEEMMQFWMFLDV
jgi:hypothetical protein